MVLAVLGTTSLLVVSNYNKIPTSLGFLSFEEQHTGQKPQGAAGGASASSSSSSNSGGGGGNSGGNSAGGGGGSGGGAAAATTSSGNGGGGGGGGGAAASSSSSAVTSSVTDVMTSSEDVINPPGPTAGPTQRVLLVRVTQLYDYVTTDECETEEFQTALTSAIASGMGLAAGNVMYQRAAERLDEDGNVLSSVDITYTIMQTGSNVDQIAASLKGLAVTYAVMEGLASAGYPNAVASGDDVSLEDVSATLAPTPMPTVDMAVLRITMRITSATQKDAGNEEFTSALQKG